MSDQALTISELNDIAKEYFHNDFCRIEVCEIGVRFVCHDRDKNEEYSSFFQTPLRVLSSNIVRAFLEAETRPENGSGIERKTI
ncbi:hypothetical protein [Entomohabitans teleogrylli]|uniref:hypothetical protein n=1 Tax=Entomohabitans teleogrylli TaxID=1384589 RepID=UPI00073D344D|nr:hypothetical protein [Entomohabitans teleogrylli]